MTSGSARSGARTGDGGSSDGGGFTLARRDPVRDQETFVRKRPDVINGDIIGTRVSLSTSSIRVGVRFARLVRTGGYRVGVQMRTDTRHWYAEYQGTASKAAANSPGFYGGAYRDVPCAGLEADIDARHDRAEILIPRRCLKNPRWIQFHVFSGTWRHHGAFTLDDAFKAGWSGPDAYTWRIYLQSP